MPKFDDSLRGYAFPTHQRDRFRCVYCGLDGSVWPLWLYLSWDHLLPKGHPQRDNPEYIVTACRFCNEACNRTRFDIEGKTPAQLVTQKKEAIDRVREQYRHFWKEGVQKGSVPGGTLSDAPELRCTEWRAGMNPTHIQLVAYAVRKAMERAGAEFPRLRCMEGAAVLERALWAAGLEPVACGGQFLLDAPAPLDPDDPAAGYDRKHGHVWVEVGIWVVDITADQFNPYLKRSMPPVYIGERGDRYQYEGPQTDLAELLESTLARAVLRDLPSLF